MSPGAAEIRLSAAPAGPQRRPHAVSWRNRVSQAASAFPATTAVLLDFVVKPGRWIDVDTLAVTTLAGLRDAGVFGRGFPDLDGFVATKRFATEPGAVIRGVSSAGLANLPTPGAVAMSVTSAARVRPGDARLKRRWRETVAAAWGGRATLEVPVWADIAVGAGGSIVTPIEPVLDALEPCLGRDPRGQRRQEFFPNDDRIEWLRVRRGPPAGPPLALSLGVLTLEQTGGTTGSESTESAQS